MWRERGWNVKHRSITVNQMGFSPVSVLCNYWHPLTFIWPARQTALIPTPIKKTLMASLGALGLAQTRHTFSSEQWLLYNGQLSEFFIHPLLYLNMFFTNKKYNMQHLSMWMCTFTFPTVHLRIYAFYCTKTQEFKQKNLCSFTEWKQSVIGQPK